MFGLLQDETYQRHQTGAHPERPQRLEAIREGFAEADDLALHPLTPVTADLDTVALVHDRSYIDLVKDRVEQGYGSMDADTVICPDSFDTALFAVGGAVAGIDAIMKGELDQAFFAVRPPGHHAERDRAMGFCLFNNVGIAAAHLVARHGLDRVAIFDFDVHHGNGTMHSFYEDPSVFYGSVHQWPHYPGTGLTHETGQGAGLGTTLNFPHPAGAGDEEYEAATSRFADAMDTFKPDFLLISAGFDAHWSDQLSGHQVTEEGYENMASTLTSAARTHCGGRLAFFLEGGYNLNALKTCIPAVVRTVVSG